MRIRTVAPVALLTLAATPLAAQGSEPPAEKTAAQPPAADAKPAADTTYDEVIVTAEARDRRQIDRRSYVIKDTPAAETKTATEVLRDLPSVSVDGAGRLRLLNNGNVRILIDGRTVPDPQGFLRNLTGNEIARVEVVTNPSAAFASDGTAGVINVILRKTYRPGIAGTASGSVDSLGGGGFSLTPSWTDGPWTLSTSPRLGFNRSRSDYVAAFIPIGPDPTGINNRIDTAETRGRSLFFANRTQLGYKLNERRSVTGSLSFATGDNDTRRVTDVVARGGEFAPFSQRNDTAGRFDSISGALEYRANGRLPSQSLTAATTVSWYRFGSGNTFLDRRPGGAVGTLFSSNAGEGATVESKIDYTTPRGKADRLSVGAQFEGNRATFADRSFGTPLIGPARNLVAVYGGNYLEGAAYATYQTDLGKLKVLPGLRVQSRRYLLDGPGDDGPRRTDLFPSLHLEHPVVKGVDVNLSYSRRVDWLGVAALVPLLRFSTPTSAFIGNPRLDPSFTDAVEAKLAYAGKVHNATITLFERTTHRIQENATLVRPDGVLLLTTINTGDRIERGAEVAAQGRIMPRLRYNISGNLAAVDRPVIGGTRRATDSQYGGKAQLSYAEPRAAAPGFDQIEAIVEYVGPTRAFQSETDGFVTTNLTWTHRFTPRLSSVLNAQNVLGSPVYRSTSRLPNLLFTSRSTSAAPVIRLSLTRALGKPPAQPPRRPAG